LDKIEGGQVRLETRLDKVEVGLGRVETRLDKVEIGQEEIGDHVKQIAEGHAAVIAAIQSGVRVVCDYFDDRILPLEAAIREQR
jgi:hypothetical protein